MKWFQRAASAANHDRSITQYAAANALLHTDALDFIQKHLRSFALNEACLQDHSFIGDGELRRIPAQRSPKNRDCRDHKHRNQYRQGGLSGQRIPQIQRIENQPRERKDHGRNENRLQKQNPMQPRPICDRFTGDQIVFDVSHARILPQKPVYKWRELRSIAATRAFIPSGAVFSRILACGTSDLAFAPDNTSRCVIRDRSADSD